MKKLLYILFFFALTTGTAFASDKKNDKKETQLTKVKVLLRDARNAIKNSKDQVAAEKKLTDALTRPELTNSERAEILYTAAELRQSINAGENLKAYLKQKYDTVLFFNSILKMYDYVLRCDSVDTLSVQNGKSKPMFRQKGRDLLLKHRSNLLSGGKFLMRRDKNAEAFPFFTMYLRTMNEPIINQYVKKSDTDSLRYRLEYWATYTAYNSNKHLGVIEHIDSAIVGMKIDSIRMALMEVKCLTYQRMEDTINYVNALYEGMNAYPNDDYFFLHAMDIIQARCNYDLGIQLADTMLHRIGPRQEYYFAKSLMYLKKEMPDSCIAMSDSTLQINPDHPDALYNLGISYINKALIYAETACTDYRDAKCRRDREYLNGLYQNAQVPMERLRALKPDDVGKWGKPLYRIYMNLNKGREFDEIDRLINKQ